MTKEMVPFRVIYLDMPDEIRGKMFGCTTYDQGRYFVFIDKDLDEQARRDALRHELSHIILGHLTDPRTTNDHVYLENFDSVEAEACEYAARMTDEELDQLMTYADMIRTI
jgi:Predicted Zn peptidase